MAPSIFGLPISVVLSSFKSKTFLNFTVSPILASSFSISSILLAETLYCFPPVSIIANDIYAVVIGSRILGNGAFKGGMPLYKYISNRFLTLFQNILIGQKLSEYHSGYRAFSAESLGNINLKYNSDDFIFDNQMLCQLFNKGFDIAEITCPTRYTPESSSINFTRSVTYGIGVIKTSIQYFLHQNKIIKCNLFQ